MKKVLLSIVALLMMVAGAYAQVRFRSNQNMCHDKVQILLYSSGRYVVYDDGVEAFSGAYTVESSYKAILLDVNGETLRCNYTLKKDGQNLASLTFRGATYYPCSR